MIDFAEQILHWYDRHARQLPWRVSPVDRQKGVLPDPYKVWLSEIMLQQTTIPHGIRYFLRFTELWPDVHQLAAADRDDIMREWAGLGYYARARNLHKCAIQVSEAGGFPTNSKDLQKLPGIGPYTAGAIASIAFDEPIAAVDGNVERVLSRFLALEDPLPQIKATLKLEAQARVPVSRAGDFAQAMMDLGATVCAPRSPDCLVCPLTKTCKGRELGNPAKFPVKPAKKKKPERYGQVFLIHDGQKLVVEKRKETGLLAGMIGLPTSDWAPVEDHHVELDATNFVGKRVGRVEHVFTHFRLHLDVVEVIRSPDLIERSVDLNDLENAGFPSVFQKAVTLWKKSRLA